MKSLNRIACLFYIIITAHLSFGQTVPLKNKTGVYTDKQGVIRWKSTNQEAVFFGVNYTVPFAYGYRSHLVLGVNPEKAIQEDVYHMARLGIDAFRVHVWDTEITDAAGNLLQNEHLRLFDYLLAELKKRNIKILITPLAFWGNGYPEKDEKTAGFSSIYNKQQVLVTEQAIKAQENYLKQFFQHVNPYTKAAYLQDPDVIAAEINNEPHHSGPKNKVLEYVNRMVAAVKSTGWDKPVFYNISESPWYSDAVSNANIDGVSFQWYPTGLVAGRTLKGNYLPNVDKYAIPFDTVAAYKNKARMVYEFDAGDVLQPIMYPAMARSFRTAGFQWATQFAYDPMATAYANTEYQTHYLNLAYTPAKAISLLIASKVFHTVPRLKSYGTYPADSIFGAFRVSYAESLSEMNSPEEFYYTNNTTTKPAAVSKLKHLAGVGSSAIAAYKGYGAYFLDKLENGVWRLEVMPDAIHIRDPFAKASLKKEVTRIQYENQEMKILLPDLGTDFSIKGINENNTLSLKASGSIFNIYPGTYLITKKGKSAAAYTAAYKTGNLGLNEFAAPLAKSREVFAVHQPIEEVSAAKAFTVSAKITGLSAAAKASLILSTSGRRYRTIPMDRKSVYDFQAEVPADLVQPGTINYRIAVQQGEEYTVFPGNHAGNPHAWDYWQDESWQSYAAAPGSPLEIFNAGEDKDIAIVPSGGEGVTIGYSSASQPKQLILTISASDLWKKQLLGFSHYAGDKFQGRRSELASFSSLLIKTASRTPQNAKLRVSLISTSGEAFTALADLTNELSDTQIPLSSFVPDQALLLPRPYPGFLPLWFKASSSARLKLHNIEKIEVSIGSEQPESAYNKEYNLQVQSIWLKK